MRRSSRHDLFDRDYPGKTVRGQALRLWLLLAGIGFCLLIVFFGGEYLQRWFAYRDARVGLPGNASVGWLDPVRDIVLNTLPEVPFLGSTRGLEESGLQIHDLRIASDELQALTATAEAVTAQVVSTGIERPYSSGRVLVEWAVDPGSGKTTWSLRLSLSRAASFLQDQVSEGPLLPRQAPDQRDGPL